MKNISATQKGLVTGLLIIALSAIVYKISGTFENSVRLGAYALYAAGILWTLYDFNRRSPVEEQSFRNYFAQGFKCFIVVTLLMVCATWLFLKFNESFRNEMVNVMYEELKRNPDFTKSDIDKHIANYRQLILPAYTMSTIFAYLGVGALITVMGTVFFKYIKK
ncbi:MAG: DUF4199 family protein [Ferruginibacter sp.]